MQIYIGESVAETLNDLGISALFVSRHVAPQLVHYNFNLKNIFDLGKLKKVLPMLSAICGVGVSVSEDRSTHFALDFEQSERQICRLTEFCETLRVGKPFSIALGQDTFGNYLTATLDDLVHLFVGGCSGAGKSVALHSIITSLLCYNEPKDMEMVLIDAKQTEFEIYRNVAHLREPIVNTAEQAKKTLENLVAEMERRYSTLKSLGLQKNEGQFPKIVCVIDEICDLIAKDEEIKTPLILLMQKARACGIHIIYASQTIRTKYIDGLMLANTPSKICLTCASVRESVLILGKGGAEKLTFKGDAILDTPNIKFRRIQSPYISMEEIKKCME